jgi:hypothetical protein
MIPSPFSDLHGPHKTCPLLLPVLPFLFLPCYLTCAAPLSAAIAQEDQYDCASFGSQESAQAELDPGL